MLQFLNQFAAGAKNKIVVKNTSVRQMAAVMSVRGGVDVNATRKITQKYKI